MITGFLLLLTAFCIRNIKDEQTKIVMFWILFFVFAIIFNILANM